MLATEQGWPGMIFVQHLPSPWYHGCFAFTVYFPSRYPFECPLIKLAAPLPSHPLVQQCRVRHLSELAATRGSVDEGDRENEASQVLQGTAAGGAPQPPKSTFIPFESVYCTVDPMRVSVMARVLQHIKQLFYPCEWPLPWLQQVSVRGGAAKASATAPSASSPTTLLDSNLLVNRVLARRDVERRSVTQEVVLGKPYVEYLGSDVMRCFLHLWEQHTLPSSSGVVRAAATGTDKRKRDTKQSPAAQKDDDLEWTEWYGRVALPRLWQMT